MNMAHLHLILNHVPVIGSIVGIVILAWAWVRRNEAITRLGLGFFVVLGVMGIIVYLTGEGAEEIVERLPGISEPLIEEHAEIALAATIVLGVYGAFALGLLLGYRTRFPGWVTPVTLLLAVAPAILMAWTANEGGMIRHEEIREERAMAGRGATEAEYEIGAPRSGRPAEREAGREL